MKTLTSSQAAIVYATAEKAFSQGNFQAGAEILSSIPDDAKIVADPPAPPPIKTAPPMSGFVEDPYRPHLSAWYRPRFGKPAVIRLRD